MNKAMYPGSFDPITIGHLDIIERASKLYDEVIIAIMQNPNKKGTFSVEERKALIEKCIGQFNNVKVVIGEGLTINLAKKCECKVLIRGIRAVADYEYELALASTNMKLDNSIETILMVAKPEFSFLSSSIVKEVAHFNGNIDGLIPTQIQKEVIERLK